VIDSIFKRKTGVVDFPRLLKKIREEVISSQLKLKSTTTLSAQMLKPKNQPHARLRFKIQKK